MQIICHTDFKHHNYSFQLLIIENTDGKSDVYEAWIRAKGYGIMDFMFGCDKADVKLEDFQSIVGFNALSYAENYIDEFISEGDEE